MNRPAPNPPRSQPSTRWPHWLAWALACAVYPLIWMGGLVTTYEAGMAVPDWPTTYGHWFYPMQAWLTAAGDLFLEHGHRLLAQAVGLLVIALAVVVWRTDPRRWMRGLVVAAVLGVLLQGTLGGLRVWFDQRLLANIHGCTAPLFFALCTTLVTFTSRRWLSDDSAVASPAAGRSRRETILATVAVYGLIVLGAQLRHQPWDSWSGWFTIWLWSKLILAGVVLAGLIWIAVDPRQQFGQSRRLIGRAWLVLGLFSVQLILGGLTWVVNYGIPRWFANYIWAIDYTIVAEGPLQVWTTTGHAAIGSLTLVAALNLAMWTFRDMSPGRPS